MNSFSHNYQSTLDAVPLACAPHVSGLPDEKSLLLAQTIYEATEQVRERLRADEFWGAPICLPPRGFSPKGMHVAVKPATRINFLVWPALLTMEPDCLGHVCRVAGCEERELMTFVLSICPYEHLPHLEQFFHNRAVMNLIIKNISAAVKPMKAKQVRIEAGASTGGKKSSITRAKAAKTPSLEVLLRDVSRLVETGRVGSEVAGILAVKYDVTPKTIRQKLRQGQ